MYTVSPVTDKHIRYCLIYDNIIDTDDTHQCYLQMQLSLTEDIYLKLHMLLIFSFYSFHF